MARKRSKRLLIEDVELRRYLAEPLSAWRIDSNRLATPLSVALAVGDTSLVALLTAHGAQQPTGATAAGMPYLPCCTDADERARFGLRGSLRQLVKLNRQGAIALLRVVADVLRDTHEP